MKELIKISRDKMKYFIIVILLGGINCLTFSQSQKLNSNQATPIDNEIVVSFMKPLGVTIPAEWIKFAYDNIKMLDQDGIDVAHQLILADFAKIPQQDRLAYVLMAFDAIHKAYDHEEHITAGDAFLDHYLNYETMLNSLSKNFGVIWTQNAQAYIAQNKQEIAQIKQEIAQKEQNIAQMDQFIAQKNKEAELWLQKLYNLNPNDKELKKLATNAKKNYTITNYTYSEQTAKIFEALGIK